MRTNVVRALADIVATKLGIILSFSSFHLLFSQKGFSYNFEVTKKIRFIPPKMGGTLPSPLKWVASKACDPVKLQLRFRNGVRAPWVSEDPPR